MKQDRSKSLSIFTKYKNMLEDLIDSLVIKRLTILKQIYLLNNDIPSSQNNPNNLIIDNNFLNRL